MTKFLSFDQFCNSFGQKLKSRWLMIKTHLKGNRIPLNIPYFAIFFLKNTPSFFCLLNAMNDCSVSFGKILTKTILNFNTVCQWCSVFWYGTIYDDLQNALNLSRRFKYSDSYKEKNEFILGFRLWKSFFYLMTWRHLKYSVTVFNLPKNAQFVFWGKFSLKKILFLGHFSTHKTIFWIIISNWAPSS